MMILGEGVAVPPGIEEVVEWGEDDTEMTDLEMTAQDMGEKKEIEVVPESLVVEIMMKKDFACVENSAPSIMEMTQLLSRMSFPQVY